MTGITLPWLITFVFRQMAALDSTLLPLLLKLAYAYHLSACIILRRTLPTTPWHVLMIRLFLKSKRKPNYQRAPEPRNTHSQSRATSHKVSDKGAPTQAVTSTALPAQTTCVDMHRPLDALASAKAHSQLGLQGLRCDRMWQV